MRTREWMKVSRRKGVLLAVSVLAVLLVLIMTAPAFAADRWTDISDAQWLGTYKITADDAATVAEGYPDNTFRPGLALPRAQSAKMIVDGFGLATANPATPTFTDVAPSHYYYPWIEGGAAVGAIQGFDDDTFRPSISVIRQQFNSILGRILSQIEIQYRGHIQGSNGQYPTLAAWFAAEGAAVLDDFADVGDVAAVHRPGSAYLAFRAVVLGRPAGMLTYLDPTASITRAQAVAMIVRARTVAETFAPTVTYTITASAGANGTIAPTGAVTVAQGANQTFTITPASGYVVDDVLVDGVSAGAVTTYTFTNVTANHTIAASFKSAPTVTYTITASAGANGTIAPTGAVTVAQGANQTFTITPASGYVVDDVLVDGVSAGAVTTYTFTNVTANHTIAASFKSAPTVTYTITASAGANGTIAPTGAVTVAQGANQTFTITPASGYVVDDVLVDGVSAGAVTTYTFTNVTANHTIAASFKSAPKTLFGVVYGLGDTQYLLQGATVTVQRVSNGSLIGTATTGLDGSFSINMTGVDLGTQVLVQATCPGYVLVAILGIYDENAEEVNFQRFTTPTISDRRLAEGNDAAGPPYNGLLPD